MLPGTYDMVRYTLMLLSAGFKQRPTHCISTQGDRVFLCGHHSNMIFLLQVQDFNLGDQLMTAISTNLTIGAAQAPPMATPAQNTTVVTVRSAQSVADIIKYNITACMVSGNLLVLQVTISCGMPRCCILLLRGYPIQQFSL